MPYGQVPQCLGMTQSILSQRLTSHKQQGSILENQKKFYNENISQNTLKKYTKIIDRKQTMQKIY